MVGKLEQFGKPIENDDFELSGNWRSEPGETDDA